MEGGRLVVVAQDFRATCFMPPPFIEVALKKPRDSFCRTVVGQIAYPHRQSNDATALLSASSSLIPYGSKPVGEPRFFNFVRTQADFNRCAALPSGVSRTSNTG